MKRIFFFILLVSFSLEQGLLKRSQRSKHGEDCFSDQACEEGLLCTINRCYTKFESSNLKALGLYEKNICNIKKPCSTGKKCVKHRCIDINTPPEPQKNRTANIDNVHLIFSGKIHLNKKPYLSGIKQDNTFNYDHLFKHILGYIKNADLAVVPQSTPFFIQEPGKKLIKNPKNTPKELGAAIAKAGFKVVLHANSNAYSNKEKGIIDTLNFWKNNYPEIKPLGISSNIAESQEDYYIFTKNNIKIGIINYSGFAGKAIPTKNKFMINIINKKKVEECVTKLKQEVDFIIVCINWGDKYSHKPNNNEISWAKTLAGLGVNLIVGNYPAYVQPVSLVKADNGNCALVFFSLGILIGENHKKINSLGALANIVISKENGKTKISSYHLIPTITHNVASEEYSVYRLTGYNDDLGKEANKKFSIEKMKKKCREIMGAFAHCG